LKVIAFIGFLISDNVLCIAVLNEIAWPIVCKNSAPSFARDERLKDIACDNVLNKDSTLVTDRLNVMVCGIVLTNDSTLVMDKLNIMV